MRTQIFGYALALTAAANMLGCAQEARPEQPRTEVRIARTPDLIPEMFVEKMPDVVFQGIGRPGGVLTVDYIAEGGADMSLTHADAAYLAFTKGTESDPKPHKNLRAVAAMNIISAMHLISGPKVKLDDLSGLRGFRIGAGLKGGFAEQTIRLVLPQIGVPLTDVHLDQSSVSQFPELMANHSLDAAFLVTRYPTASPQNILALQGAALVPLKGPKVDKLREDYPFFRKVIIPAGAYGQKNDVETLGVDAVWIVREDVSPEIVYRMLSSFFSSLPELVKTHPALEGLTLDEAPATPIPLHPGASRFYRERQLVVR
jgi:uncharacterized protein